MADQQLPEPIIQVVKDTGDVKIHTFISAEAFLANATHIIESPNALVIVDGQFVVPYAMQFRGYANSLGKPIERVYLSHNHPDHFFGMGAAFDDVEIYALPETIAFLEQSGEEIRASRAAIYGPFVADKVVIPGNAVSAGTEVVDGVTYEHVVNTDAETDFQLALKLPDQGVYITQDLLYSGQHIYITPNLDHWISILEGLESSEYEIFLPGHGKPADKEEVRNSIKYLQFAKKAHAEAADAEAFKAALLEAFPERSGAAIFDIYLPYLYGGGSE
jgi:glyoxylase-like metal-dependent hydrolase (beta-lactamase superfamily II)